MSDLKHVAIIMDGNGRWATNKKLPRTAGHYEGVKRVRDISLHANELGISCLTLYAFSTENWKRSGDEVNYIMSLPKIFFESYLKELMENNIRVKMIGSMERLPEETRKVFESAIKTTENNTRMILNFAVNYGSRTEIVNAAKKFALDYQKNNDLDLDEESFGQYLDTKGLPDIDLMIRTSGEQRISNFLLYQLAYAELVFTDVYWPDFKAPEFDKCLEEYYRRNRRFGAV